MKLKQILSEALPGWTRDHQGQSASEVNKIMRSVSALFHNLKSEEETKMAVQMVLWALIDGLKNDPKANELSAKLKQFTVQHLQPKI
jgi:hypothetical protein